MPGNLSDFAVHEMLDHTFRSANYPSPANTFLALFVDAASPGDNNGGIGNEVTNVGTGYVRQAIVGTVAADRMCANTLLITFPAPTADYDGGAPVVSWGIYDAVGHGAGNLLAWGTFENPITILNGGAAFVVEAGDLVIGMADGVIATYLVHEWLDHLFRNAAYADPVAVFASSYSVEPGDDDTGTEMVGGAYARQAATFGAAAARKVVLTADLTFPQATANYPDDSIAGGVCDLAAAGNLLWHWPMVTAPLIRTVKENDTYEIEVASGGLELEVAAT